MNFHLTQSLAEIVNKDHRAASVFEKYHLDFCCKGKRTLQQACSESNIELDKILAELNSITAANEGSSIDFNNLSLAELVKYIVNTHHAYVKRELPVIAGYLQKVSFKHASRHPELIRIFNLFQAVEQEMSLHLKKEELILFPRIIEIERQKNNRGVVPVNIQAPVDIMEQEHEYAGNLLAEIRDLTNNYTAPGDACTTFRLAYASLQAFEEDLHKHVHLENNILFPKALQLTGLPEYSLN